MAISFPTSPSANQAYTVGSKTWVYNGYAWDIQVANIAPIFNTANAAFDKANLSAQIANSSANSANAYTITVGAAANTWANTKLSNTDNVVFNGSLQIANTLYVKDVVIAN